PFSKGDASHGLNSCEDPLVALDRKTRRPALARNTRRSAMVHLPPVRTAAGPSPRSYQPQPSGTPALQLSGLALRHAVCCCHSRVTVFSSSLAAMATLTSDCFCTAP